MSGYLARLKSANQSPRELTKPTKAPFVSNVSTGGEPFSEIAPRQPEGRNNQFPDHYAHTRAREADPEQAHPLAEESRKRYAFCEMHRRIQGGECNRLDVIDGRQGGSREAALSGCLLWQVVKAEPSLDRRAGAEVLEGITVADCLAMLADCKEPPDLFWRDRRWLLGFAACIRNRQGLVTLKTPGAT